MPIGDLLASISGSEPPPKRKVIGDDSLSRPTPNKVPRTSTTSTPATSSSGPSRAQQPSRPLDRPNAVARPSSTTNGNGTGNGLGALGSTRMSGLSSTLKPTNGTHRVTKPTATPRFSGTARPSQSASGGSGGDGPAPAPRAPPKKGSFAEILARGKAAQATMGHVGKIQHKKTEKGAAAVKPGNDAVPSKGAPVKADARGGRAAPAGSRGTTAVQQSRKPVGPTSGYSGTAKPNAARPVAGRSTTPTNGHLSSSSSAAAKRSSARPTDRKAAASSEPERPKKAVSATTGYTGTARPRPGATSSNSNKHPPQRGGALLNRPPARRQGASSARGGGSRYEDDYDEELDDFIEYDDEEEEEEAGGYGRRYTYNDESDSDMEAGMDELDIEERMAERIARREDIEEEKLEKSLKAAKEERKRKALEELRAKRR